MRIVRLTDECGNEMAVDLDRVEAIRIDDKYVIIQVGGKHYRIKCSYGDLLTKWAGGSICNLKEDKQHTSFTSSSVKKVGDW